MKQAGTRGRNESLRRVLLLMQRIEGERYLPSLDDLARDLGVCRRTVYRDLQLLESIGHRVPLYRWNERLDA